MKILRQLLLLTFVLAILSGSMGISVLVHHCKSSKKTNYVAYPEISIRSVKSCCSSSHKRECKESYPGVSIKKTACCNFDKLFLKVKPYQLPCGIKAPQQSIVSITSVLLFVNISLTDNPSVFEFHPPPTADPPRISGKEIVYFIQQLRIPFAC